MIAVMYLEKDSISRSGGQSEADSLRLGKRWEEEWFGKEKT